MTHLDLYLSHPTKPGQVINVQSSLVGGLLLFKPVHLTWNATKQDNDERAMIPLDAKEFGGWYQAQMAMGWVVQPN